ncbi:MAG: hypothetical protein P4L79_11080 [Legionella sp.]|uniref:hypothetical protein n=1 Tax=Legionella sp. TaxID=459 RepID=UPI00284BF2BD|nr:hypothetical protein [Legionella sp.]
MKILRDIIEAEKKEDKKSPPEPKWYIHDREGNIHSKYGRQDDALKNAQEMNAEFWSKSKKIQQYECSHVDSYYKKMLRRGMKESITESEVKSAVWLASGIYDHPTHGKRIIKKKLMAEHGGSMTPLSALAHIKTTDDHKKMIKKGFKLCHIETRPDLTQEGN